jgi:hypothetical protein
VTAGLGLKPLGWDQTVVCLSGGSTEPVAGCATNVPPDEPALR